MTGTAAATLQRPGTPDPLRTAGFRPELQGLRTVAVMLVVLYHLWPNRITGGYVGVDVFFVISGYLITSHIHREVQRTGTVSLRQFWARRIRRLLPASLLVLLVSLGAAVLWLPATLWANTARQVAASALYVENWALASDAVSYMAADNVPTVAQHFWSLSVEEQFYLLWPVLVLLLVLWGRRRGLGVDRTTRHLVVGIGVLAAVSLVWSVLATAADSSSAYFVTPTRVWEFAAGAMVALVGTAWLRGRALRVGLAWGGLLAVAVAGLAFDGRSPFPGWIALLPVLGALAVIAAADEDRGPGRFLALRPMSYVGDISYSVYLWHWPLIVVWPFVTGTELRTVDKLAILVATLLLAALSKVAVEDPGRRGRLLAAAPWRSFAFALVGMAVVAGAAVAVQGELDRRAAAATPVAIGEIPDLAGEGGARSCFGPAALDPGSGCDPAGDGTLMPAPEIVVAQNTQATYPGCQANGTSPDVITCTLGSTDPHPERTIALVGDSHATMWFPAFDDLGKERNWRVLTYTKSSCPLTTAVRTYWTETNKTQASSCVAWNDAVMADLLAADDLSYVFTASYSTAFGWESRADHPLADPRTDGFIEAWDRLTGAGREVFVLADVPRTQGDNVPNCLAEHPESRTACAVPRAEALPGSALVAARALLPVSAPVHVIDLSDRFCDEQLCYPVVGDLIVYRDFSHLAADYARALEPYLQQRIDAATRDGS